MTETLKTFGGHPVPRLFNADETSIAERLARELFASAVAQELQQTSKMQDEVRQQAQEETQ